MTRDTKQLVGVYALGQIAFCFIGCPWLFPFVFLYCWLKERNA